MQREMVDEAKQRLADAREIGDKELIAAMEEAAKGASSSVNEAEFEEMYVYPEETERKARERIAKMERENGRY